MGRAWNFVMVTTRERRVRYEASALWRELFDSPPPRELDTSTLLMKIVQRAEPPSYDVLWPRRLRDVTLPEREGARHERH